MTILQMIAYCKPMNLKHLAFGGGRGYPLREQSLAEHDNRLHQRPGDAAAYRQQFGRSSEYLDERGL